MFQKFVLIAGLIVVVGCTATKNTAQIQSGSQSNIINGTPVLETDVLSKSTAGLLVNYPYDGNEKVWFQGCSASILAARFILNGRSLRPRHSGCRHGR